MLDRRAISLAAIPLVLWAGACSLLAPSDESLMGRGEQPSGIGAGGARPLAGAPATETGGEQAEDPSRAGAAAVGGTGGTGGAGAGTGAASAGTGSSSVAGSVGEGGNEAVTPPDLIPRDGLLLWLMADHGVGQADGGVALWADQSGSHADAKQSLIAWRPKLVMVGERPWLEFDGVDDQLVLGEGFSDFSRGLSLFVIVNQREDAFCPSMLHLSNAPEEQDIELGRHLGSIHYEVEDEDFAGPEDAFALGQTLLLNVVHEINGSVALRINGNFMAGDELELPATQLRLNNFIGRSLYADCALFGGRIAEIILYARAVSLADRSAIQSYLQSKWQYEPSVKPTPFPTDSANL